MLCVTRQDISKLFYYYCREKMLNLFNNVYKIIQRIKLGKVKVISLHAYTGREERRKYSSKQFAH